MREPSSMLQCVGAPGSQLGDLTVTGPSPVPASGFCCVTKRCSFFLKHVTYTGLAAVKARAPVQWFLSTGPELKQWGQCVQKSSGRWGQSLGFRPRDFETFSRTADDLP